MHDRRNSRQPLHGDGGQFDPGPILALGVLSLLFGADHFRARLPAGGTFIAWDKTCEIGPEDSFADCEFMWTTERIKRNIVHYLWKGIACVKLGEDGGARVHSTQKPIGLMRWCLDTLKVPVGATVADFYMGSGTTGVACVQTGRRFIGIEIDERYCEIARRRIEEAQVEVACRLPMERPRRAEQLALVEPP